MNGYDFNGRVAIVTAGGQGIGLPVAERMLSSADKVSVWDRDGKLLEALSTRYDTGLLQTLNVDIGTLPAVETATKAVIEKFGQIDVLVNNAAIVGPNANTWEYPRPKRSRT
jgi:2-dehydro-3-deoxy-L-rhamnonate dehydrogenase (NAD+)